MKNLIKLRNFIIGFLYRYILKKIFFLFDAERVHDFFTVVGKLLGKYKFTRKITSIFFNAPDDPILEQNILGIKFSNPIGLSAGFDKNAELTDIIPEVGFGFEEIGSITAEPCEGNPKPRLWRLKKSKALVVYYGLKNDGAEKLSEKLKNKKNKIPIGINIAKTNCKETAETEKSIEDYVKSYKKFLELDIGDYFTINISCPNTFGGEPFHDSQKLDKLLTALEKHPTKKPVFLKISPDLTDKEVDAILEISAIHHINGFICTNLTKKRENLKIMDEQVPKDGGISGKAVEDIANKMIASIHQKTKGKYIIIGCGGVFCAEDAYKKIRLGASLIELITGMIFEGPQLISQINLELSQLLKNDGFKNIKEAVGYDFR